MRESATNPRRTFNAGKLQELADSIKGKGVLQPLIVRPVDDLTPYEIIAGARRFRSSKLAQVGLPTMLKVSVSPFASAAVGRNEELVPVCTLVSGEPAMVGALLTTAAETLIWNGASDATFLPSLAEMVMSGDTPAADGVPLRRPVVEEKVAHVGLPLIRNTTVRPSGSIADGWKP